MLPIFDSHFHIIDHNYPLVENQDYLPDSFTTYDYIKRTNHLNITGGAIVSGSFQSFDQSYLRDALQTFGPNFVGVTQLPHNITDSEIIQLNNIGVRAIRFNLRRGGSETIHHLERFSKRVYDLVGWHSELYVDSRNLTDLRKIVENLPAVSIDHLGLSMEGFNDLLLLVEKGVRVKATGFGRVDLDVKNAIRQITSINPSALMFGTDLPSTRATIPFQDKDIEVILDTLGEKLSEMVLYKNAIEWYRPIGL